MLSPRRILAGSGARRDNWRDPMLNRRKMKLANQYLFALTLLGLFGLVAGCQRQAEMPASQPSTPAQSVAPPDEATTPVARAASAQLPAGNAAELQAAITTAQSAPKTQNYSNAVQRFDALRSSGSLTGDQLSQIQDAEARMMRELAAKAAAGDQNALRQFQEISNRPRSRGW